MSDRLLADMVVVVHLAFICFVLFGGFLVLRWPRLAWLHVPAALWGGFIEIGGWVCPLTYLENHYRKLGLQAGYGVSFVEQYLVPVIYPALWFTGEFPRWILPAIGVLVLGFNGFWYVMVWKRFKK